MPHITIYKDKNTIHIMVHITIFIIVHINVYIHMHATVMLDVIVHIAIYTSNCY